MTKRWQDPTQRSSVLLMVGALLTMVTPTSQAQEANYDEELVPEYTLPSITTSADGSQITTEAEWWKVRRPEIFAQFEEQMFGRAPGRPEGLHWEVFEESDTALGGLAERKQVAIYFSDDPHGPRMDLLLYLPKHVEGKVPLFLGLNFGGNHTIADDPAIRLSESWMRPSRDETVTDNRATEASRGKASSRWPVNEILARGYGLGVIYYGDIDPDFDDGFKNGVHALYYQGDAGPKADEWGSIATWAWGLSRAVDYLATDNRVDEDRVAVVGHSRLGKTSLWAGAADQRFAMVVSNDSGCGGAALSRRAFGETVQRINTSFPHWFCDNFLQYNGRESELPFDQHMLIALAAPRPVLVCSAQDDRWADPRGEFLAAQQAAPAYELFGMQGIQSGEMPDVNHLVGDRVGYHIRPGGHDMTLVDWQVYMDFADRFLK